jgi:hypothetical protein
MKEKTLLDHLKLEKIIHESRMENDVGYILFFPISA